jgi:hypothetical protein
MTLFDKLLLVLYFLGIIFIQCKWQAAFFKANKPISHVKHAIYYLLTIGPAVWFFWPVWWQVIVIALLERLALFDGILNALRSKPLLYNGAGTTGSILDKWENSLALWALAGLKMTYVVIFIIVVIIL